LREIAIPPLDIRNFRPPLRVRCDDLRREARRFRYARFTCSAYSLAIVGARHSMCEESSRAVTREGLIAPNSPLVRISARRHDPPQRVRGNFTPVKEVSREVRRE